MKEIKILFAWINKACFNPIYIRYQDDEQNTIYKRTNGKLLWKILRSEIH
ncbi:MAG: hypothetical protein ACK5B9_15630 [Flavobacteriia bacterium]|jgi:hypothetical protein